MTALDQLIDAYHASFAASDCQDPDALLIEAARQEQWLLLTALRGAVGHIDFEHTEGELFSMEADKRAIIDALLSRFP